MRLFRYIPLAFCLAILSGCGAGDQTRTDPKNLISYSLPAGWEAVPASGETRFSPPGGGAEIQVNTMVIDKPRKLEAERDAWLGFQEKQGHRILENGTYEVGGFSGLSYAHELETSMGDSIQHQIILQRPGTLVMTYLMTGPDRYEELLPVYEGIVQSIEPLE